MYYALYEQACALKKVKVGGQTKICCTSSLVKRRSAADLRYLGSMKMCPTSSLVRQRSTTDLH